MALVDALRQVTQEFAELTETIDALAGRTVTVRVNVVRGAAADHAEADAIRRGLRPQQVKAIREQLGLR